MIILIFRTEGDEVVANVDEREVLPESGLEEEQYTSNCVAQDGRIENSQGKINKIN